MPLRQSLIIISYLALVLSTCWLVGGGLGSAALEATLGLAALYLVGACVHARRPNRFVAFYMRSTETAALGLCAFTLLLTVFNWMYVDPEGCIHGNYISDKDEMAVIGVIILCVRWRKFRKHYSLSWFHLVFPVALALVLCIRLVAPGI